MIAFRPLRVARLMAPPLVLATAALMALAPYATDAQSAQEAGAVSGRVVNGTAGGGPVSGVAVVLVEEMLAGVRQFDATTGPDGSFSFDGVSIQDEGIYSITVHYGGAAYGLELDVSDGPPGPVELTVYEPSDDQSILTVTVSTVMYFEVDSDTQIVSAAELIWIVNTADRTYVPGTEPMNVLRFGLPPGAQELTVDTGLPRAEVVQIDVGFALRASVPPGSHLVGFAYRFPYAGSRLGLTRSAPFGAGSLRVLARRDTIRVTSDDLADAGVVDIDGEAYTVLSAAGVARGASISLALEDLPVASLGQALRSRSEGLRLEYAAPLGLAFLMVCVMGYAVWKRGSLRPAPLPAGPARAHVGGRRLLLREISEVKSRFEDGELSEERYRSERRTLLARLAELSSLRESGEE